jgi:hypothetical protein
MFRGRTGWLLSRNTAVAALGFVLSVVGALGCAFYLEPAQTSTDAAARQIAIERSRSRMLLAATSYDDVAGQMGSLLFSFSLPRDVSEDKRAAIGDLMLRGLDHRHDGVRSYLAALAVAGAIDFPPESSRYETLVAAERANFNIDAYRAANAFERDLAASVVKAQGDAAMKAITLEPDRREAKMAETGETLTSPETKARGPEGQLTAGVIAEASTVPPNSEVVTMTFSPAFTRLMLTPRATL